MNTSATQTLPQAETPPPRLDFPGWVPPMLVKELRQGLRQRGFVGGLIAAQVVLVLMFLTGFATDVNGGSASHRLIDGIFWSTMFGTLLLLAPMRALTALSAELEARTMDLLLLTRLDAWRIVWGKWVSLMAQSLLLAIALLPYAVVRYFFGSVDIVDDLALIGFMLAGSGVFTAAGLWASGMNRVIRLLIVIGMVMLSFSVLGGIMSRHFFRGGSMISSSGSVPAWLMIAVMAWVGGCLLVYCLMMAVRWFAPIAENHAIGPRLMPLALLLPVPILALASRVGDVDELVVVWLGASGIIAAIEMANARELMAIHLRGRLGRRGVWRIIGPAMLPGWPSAALWLALFLGATVAGWGLVDLWSVADLHFRAVVWLAVLAWAGLVFPALLVALVPSTGRAAGVIYFIMHALLGIFAIMAGSTSLSHKAPAIMTVLEWISHAVPTTSFWHALNEVKSPSELPAVGLGQALGVATTLALMLFTARTYWLNVCLLRHAEARVEVRE